MDREGIPASLSNKGNSSRIINLTLSEKVTKVNESDPQRQKIDLRTRINDL